MCKLVVSEGNISIENLSKDEVKYLYNMINNTGLLERRIFNELKTKIKDMNLCGVFGFWKPGMKMAIMK